MHLASPTKEKGGDQDEGSLAFFVDELKGRAKKVVVQPKCGHVQANLTPDLCVVA